MLFVHIYILNSIGGRWNWDIHQLVACCYLYPLSRVFLFSWLWTTMKKARQNPAKYPTTTPSELPGATMRFRCYDQWHCCSVIGCCRVHQDGQLWCFMKYELASIKGYLLRTPSPDETCRQEAVEWNEWWFCISPLCFLCIGLQVWVGRRSGMDFPFSVLDKNKFIWNENIRHWPDPGYIAYLNIG